MGKIEEKDYTWATFASPGDTVDLAAAVGAKSYVMAYAWACVDVVQESQAMLGVGSDDAVKVWLNGQLVHENWVQRACTKDSDLVPVTFRPGHNQLVLKIQNGTGDWAFSCRALGPDELAQRLLAVARAGQIDAIDMLLNKGVDINCKVGPGLTALHMAQIAGRADVVKHLATKENGRLLAQLTGPGALEIFPRTPTEFFLKIVQADITLTKDQGGKVTGLTLRQSGLTGQKMK